MKLKILSWNTNFIHDNWFDRIENINKELKNSVDNYDIIAIQEATLPFSDAIYDVYKFLKQKPNIKHFASSEFFWELKFLNDKIMSFFPKNKHNIIKIFDWVMNKFLYFICWFASLYGEKLKQLYFKHPYICILFVVFCPILFLFGWIFFGMLTIINKKIKGVVKSKFIGRTLQYTEFKFNNRDVIFMNIHLSPESKKKKRLSEVKQIHNFVKHKDICILAGDFNEIPSGKIYKFLKDNGYKSVINEKYGKELNTFPSNNPIKCIAYIWIKGDNIKVVEANIFGNSKATDHKGIKVSLDIK